MATKKKTPKLLPPDWSFSRTGSGPGKLVDYPGPIIRQFPNEHGKRRTVWVSLICWAGFGGRHYLPEIKEESNRVWDGRYDKLYNKKGRWYSFMDDKAGEGRHFRPEKADGIDPTSRTGGFRTRTEAITWILKTVQEHFGDAKQYEIHLDGGVVDDDEYEALDGENQTLDYYRWAELVTKKAEADAKKALNSQGQNGFAYRRGGD